MAQGKNSEFPLEIAFQGMESTDHIQHQVYKQVRKLERFRERVINVRVVLEAAHKGGTKAELAVRVEVALRGKTIVAQEAGRPHESVYRADTYTIIRDAFDTVVRRIDEYISKHYHPTKPQVNERQRATVAYIDRVRGVGTLETEAGQSLFFHSAAVSGEDIAALEPGMEVTYSLAEAEGAYGPEAQNVSRVVGGRG